jgi:aromatic ring-opening dioxygenase LigB subunit
LKPVVVKFDESAYKEYLLLQNNVINNKTSKTKPTYEQLLNSINTAIRNLKSNPYVGNLIPRKYLTKKAITLYGTNKIFRIELVGYWRMLYTVVGSEAEVIAFILEYMDHDRYNKLFDYRKK